MKILGLTIPIRPKPIQSVSFSKHAYQDKDVKQFKNKIKYHFRKLEPNFKLIEDESIEFYVEYRYKMAKMPQWMEEYIHVYGLYPKLTNPDVTDNLNKGLVDALTGEIWKDDSLINTIIAKKGYHLKNEIYFEVFVKKYPRNKKELISLLCPS